ncbi:hypothetical protein RDABS01_021164 [Bienertia sinuspersici]
MNVIKIIHKHKPNFCGFISIFSLLIPSCLGADTITGNGYLSGDKTIISATGLFELGFYKPGNTSNYYIAIWYKKIPGKTVIWVANRDKPVSDKRTSKLRISSDGNLVLVNNESKSPIWSTNLEYNTAKPVEAVLLDDGNLVLRTGSNSSAPLWQSFEHPTDTLMPDGKLGFNRVTNLSQVLTSWKNLEDPGTGLFTVKRDPKASQFIMLWNKSEQYWTSGLWIPDQQIFSLVPELRFLKTQLYSFSYVDNETESYITYSVNNPSIVTRGCARKTMLSCEGGKSGDKFLATPSRILPEHPQFVSVANVGECESVCLRNCSCTAYAYDDNGCFIWFVELLNMRQLSDNSGKTLHIRLAASDVETSSNKILVIGILAGLGMGLVALSALAYVAYWRQKRRLFIAGKTMEHSLTPFKYRDLQSATKNFSQKLGGGGFGSVFKGTLPDSTVIAAKKLEGINHIQGEKQFRAEVSAIGTIQHVNLVRLRGFCSEGSKKLLVYEYMPNGSLNTHLFNKGGNIEILSWRVRYQIAVGTARGLAYLHEACRDCIIHCDIKPENILLDAEFCPKVADFGLAKLVGREFSRVLTTIRGTRGYLAPEWISGDAITAKADVYSYGMMLFELVSGRRNIQLASEGRLDFFPTSAMGKLTEGEDVLTILDPRLKGDAGKDEVMRICKLACWCIQDEESHRPSMGQVVQLLEGFLDINMPLMPRSLQMFAGNIDSPMFFSEYSSSQHTTETTSYASTTSANKEPSTYVSATSQSQE